MAAAVAGHSAPPSAGPKRPEKPHDLGSLIDHGLSHNPSTRKAWFEARAAAAAVGEARAPYYPQVIARFEGGSDKWYTMAATGPDNYTRVQATTILSLEYLLLDFGRRSAEVRRTLAVLDAAGFAFERKLQQVVFNVQSAYFIHEAALRRAEAARALVEASRAAAETVEREVKAGLSAIPELQAARKNLLKAEYDREAAEAAVETTSGDLCVAAGLPANTRLELAKTDLPVSSADLRRKAGQLVDEALSTRPDLAARAAEVRAGEAAIRKARADFLPEIRLQGQYAFSTFGYEGNSGNVHGRYAEDLNGYGAFLVAKWDLFDGFERLERLRRKKAETETAREELELARLDATRDVWTAYHETLSAASRVEYSESFVASARETHAAVRTAYESGLATVAEFTEAAGELALARSTRATAIAEYSTSLAALALATGLPKYKPDEPAAKERKSRAP